MQREIGQHGLTLVTNDVWSARYDGGVNDDTYLGGWRTLDPELLGYPATTRHDYMVGTEWCKRILVYERGHG